VRASRRRWRLSATSSSSAICWSASNASLHVVTRIVLAPPRCLFKIEINNNSVSMQLAVCVLFLFIYLLSVSVSVSVIVSYSVKLVISIDAKSNITLANITVFIRFLIIIISGCFFALFCIFWLGCAAAHVVFVVINLDIIATRFLLFVLIFVLVLIIVCICCITVIIRVTITFLFFFCLDFFRAL
jgi:hypothetical protein